MRLHSPVTRTHTIQLSKNTEDEFPRTEKFAPLDAPYRVPRRANSLSFINGADGDRTHDPRLAKPVLSQLSYSPTRATT